ncbi:hypothetical protein GCM10022294_19890 [Dietzia aurantiaca]
MAGAAEGSEVTGSEPEDTGGPFTSESRGSGTDDRGTGPNPECATVRHRAVGGSTNVAGFVTGQIFAAAMFSSSTVSGSDEPVVGREQLGVELILRDAGRQEGRPYRL